MSWWRNEVLGGDDTTGEMSERVLRRKKLYVQERSPRSQPFLSLMRAMNTIGIRQPCRRKMRTDGVLWQLKVFLIANVAKSIKTLTSEN